MSSERGEKSVKVEHSVLVQRIGTDQGSIEIDGQCEGFRGDMVAALAYLADRLAAPDVVAHRVVHGGPRHQWHARIDDVLMVDLHEALPLAPLHLPAALALIEAARCRWPDAVHVACFDTALFAGLPEAALRLPVAAELADLGVRRYGFHGLSVASVLRAHPDLGNVVIAHLGSGCSVTAVDDTGRPRHNTMSMTPTSGMVSGTRTGDLDPELMLYLIEQHGYRPQRLRELINHSSGLAGVAGGRHDLRDLLAAHDADATLALEIFVRSAAMAIASCATTLDSWDTLVFTGGIGEHDTATREQIAARLWLPPAVSVRVVAADEESELDLIAREVVGTS